MKRWLAILLLSLFSGYLTFHVVDQAITIDHLQSSVTLLGKREACLLKVSQGFADSLGEGEFRAWARSNLSGLDTWEKESKMIVNGVGFEFEGGRVVVE
jgi:hypothetical protein